MYLLEIVRRALETACEHTPSRVDVVQWCGRAVCVLRDAIKGACCHWKVVVVGALVISSAGGVAVIGADLANRSSLVPISRISPLSFPFESPDIARMTELIGPGGLACTALEAEKVAECLRSRCVLRGIEECTSDFVQSGKKDREYFYRCREGVEEVCSSSPRIGRKRPVVMSSLRIDCSKLHPHPENYFAAKTAISECVKVECKAAVEASCDAEHGGIGDKKDLESCKAEADKVCSDSQLPHSSLRGSGHK